MARRPLAGALLAALVAAALSVDTRVGTHRYDTDFGTNEGGWQPPDHGTTGFQIWTLDQDFEKYVMKDKTCWLVLFTSWNHDLTDPNDDAWKPYYALAMDRGLEMKIGKLNVEEQPEVAAEFNVTRAEACGKRPTPKWNLEGYCDEVVVPLPRVVLVHRWGRHASIVHAEDAPMELAAMNATINALLAVDGRWENGVCRKVGTAPPKEEL